jgi:hypothetical protein
MLSTGAYEGYVPGVPYVNPANTELFGHLGLVYSQLNGTYIAATAGVQTAIQNLHAESIQGITKYFSEFKTHVESIPLETLLQNIPMYAKLFEENYNAYMKNLDARKNDLVERVSATTEASLQIILKPVYDKYAYAPQSIRDGINDYIAVTRGNLQQYVNTTIEPAILQLKQIYDSTIKNIFGEFTQAAQTAAQKKAANNAATKAAQEVAAAQAAAQAAEAQRLYMLGQKQRDMQDYTTYKEDCLDRLWKTYSHNTPNIFGPDYERNYEHDYEYGNERPGFFNDAHISQMKQEQFGRMIRGMIILGISIEQYIRNISTKRHEYIRTYNEDPDPTFDDFITKVKAKIDTYNYMKERKEEKKRKEWEAGQEQRNYDSYQYVKQELQSEFQKISLVRGQLPEQIRDTFLVANELVNYVRRLGPMRMDIYTKYHVDVHPELNTIIQNLLSMGGNDAYGNSIRDILGYFIAQESYGGGSSYSNSNNGSAYGGTNYASASAYGGPGYASAAPPRSTASAAPPRSTASAPSAPPPHSAASSASAAPPRSAASAASAASSAPVAPPPSNKRLVNETEEMKRIRTSTTWQGILGLPVRASESDVRKAYKKLSFKYHPDRSPTNAAGNPVTAVYFKRMVRAYDVAMGNENELIAEFEIPSLE